MTDLIIDVKKTVLSIISNKILGIYLHGSYVLGGLKKKSDLDFLVVVNDGLDEIEVTKIIHSMFELSGELGSNKRYIELSILNTENLGNKDYPNRIEFIYGEWLRESFQNNIKQENQFDPEYIIMIFQALEHNKKIYGSSDLNELIPNIPYLAVLEAMYDITQSLEFENQIEDITNTILMLCRMIYTCRNQTTTSKDAAGNYILRNYNFPDDVYKFIKLQIEDYTVGTTTEYSTNAAIDAFNQLKSIVELELKNAMIKYK